MAADPTAPDAQAADDAESPADSTTDAPAADVETMSVEEARKLRKEANALRKRNKELEDSQMSEAEKLKREHEVAVTERDDARRELRSMRAQVALSDAGAVRPKLLVAELPDDAFEDDKALKGAVTALRKEYPELFRSQNGSADGGAGNANGGSATSGRSLNDLFRDLAKSAT